MDHEMVLFVVICKFYWRINRGSLPVMDGKNVGKKMEYKQDKNKFIIQTAENYQDKR